MRNILRSILRRCAFVFSSSVGAFRWVEFREVMFHRGIFSDARGLRRPVRGLLPGAGQRRQLALAARLADPRPCRPLLGDRCICWKESAAFEIKPTNPKASNARCVYTLKNIDDY